jgi:hypothetical protein
MLITLEYHRNPIRLELVRHVIPLVLFVCVLATGLGYGWARTAYSNFQRESCQPISSTMKPKINQSSIDNQDRTWGRGYVTGPEEARRETQRR